MGRFRQLLVLLLVTGARAEEIGYSIHLDGKPVDAEVLSLSGTPESPACGDLVILQGFSFVLGEPGLYDLVLAEDGTLLGRRRANGMVDLLALDLSPGALPDEIPETLRGVRLRTWTPKLAEFLARLDLSRTCVMVQSYGRSLYRFPPLPEGVRYLWIGGVNAGPEAWDALQALTELRVVAARGANLPVDHLCGAHELRVLSAPADEDIRVRARVSPRVAEPSRLGELRALRCLDLKYAEGLGDLSFLASMPHLVRLEVSGTRLTTLPDVVLPKLRVLRALARVHPGGGEQPEVDPPSVSRFRVLNPGCRVTASWTELFREALAPTTRIRVREGGGHHRAPAEAATLCDVSDPAEVRALIAGIRIAGGRSGARCFCDGQTTFEFYRGSQSLAVASFHHGSRLRWLEGHWPGDGVLTPESQLVVAGWMARHGTDSYLRRLEKLRADSHALELRRLLQSEVLGSELAARIEESATSERRLEVFRGALPEDIDRALLWLRLFGCHEGSWDRIVGVEDGLEMGFEVSTPPAAREAALRRAAGSDDPSLRRGAARWLFGMRGWRGTPPALLEEVLPVLGRRALSHPRAVNRQLTIVGLERIGSGTAAALIGARFRERIVPRSMPEPEEHEPEAWIRRAVRVRCSDRARAALALARLGRREYFVEIEKMYASAVGEDRGLLSLAVGHLRNR